MKSKTDFQKWKIQFQLISKDSRHELTEFKNNNDESFKLCPPH